MSWNVTTWFGPGGTVDPKHEGPGLCHEDVDEQAGEGNKTRRLGICVGMGREPEVVGFDVCTIPLSSFGFPTVGGPASPTSAWGGGGRGSTPALPG